jgi:hypothetical protein
MVLIGIDPHKSSHTAVAVERAGGRALGAEGAGGPLPARTAPEMGGRVPRAGVGDRVGQRAGTPASPAAGGRRRGGGRRAADAGRPGAGAGVGSLAEERPQRRPVDRHRRPAGPEVAHRQRRGPPRHPADPGRPPPRPGGAEDPGDLSAARRDPLPASPVGRGFRCRATAPRPCCAGSSPPTGPTPSASASGSSW